MSDTRTMRAMTRQEMLDAEKEHERTARIYLDAYIVFPTAENFDLLIGHLRDYQTAWMNGRNR